MSLLLLKSRPQIVIPELAARIGLNEALILQQLQYWLSETSSGISYDGHRWIYNTIGEWQKQFPYFSESTIKRTFSNLKNMGLLYIKQINKRNHDRTNFYTINYGHDALFDKGKLTLSEGVEMKLSEDELEIVEQGKLTPSTKANSAYLTKKTTKITTKNTTEKDPSCAVSDKFNDENSDPAKQVLNYFNQLTNSNYQNGQTTMGYIRGRLSEEYIADDLILVIDYLYAKWAKDDRMRDYLRPKTLFKIDNFAEYYEKAQKWHQEGRPAYCQGQRIDPAHPKIKIDITEREITFLKQFQTGWRPENQVQAIAVSLAKKAGLGKMNEKLGLTLWRGIWHQAVEQVSKEQQNPVS